MKTFNVHDQELMLFLIVLAQLDVVTISYRPHTADGHNLDFVELWFE